MESAWIYMIVLGLAIILYAMMKPREAGSNTSELTMKRVETAMDQFSYELEEENKKLIQLLVEMKNQADIRQAQNEERMKHMERLIEQNRLAIQERNESKHEHVRSNQQQIAPEQQEQASAIEVAASSTEEDNSLMQMKSRYSQLFELHANHKSIEYIAKKLSMNKGEVQLILALASREDEQHV